MPAIKPYQFDATPHCLKGKNILVTGAGAGIGKAAALSFAQHGATVILLGKSVDKLEDTYDEIESQGYPQAAIFPIDLNTASSHEFDHLAEQIEQSIGPLHGLLHNASVLGKLQPLEQTTVADWEMIIRTNLNSEFALTKSMLPLMRATDNASIIFTSSSVGRTPRAFWGAYSISKHAVECMMHIFADELGSSSSVRCNSINPGATNTAMRRRAYPGEDPSNNPPPEDIMPAYLYLMSDASQGINGQQIDAQPAKQPA